MESRCNIEKSNILTKLLNKSFSWAKRYIRVFEDGKKLYSVVASCGVAADSNEKKQR